MARLPITRSIAPLGILAGLLFASTLVAVQEPLIVAQSGPSLWYGELDATHRIFRFLIKIQETEEGRSQGRLVSLDEGGAEFPLDSFEFDHKSLAFQIKRTAASYSGKVNSTSAEIQGVWSQGGAQLALNFSRVTALPEDRPDEVWQGVLTADKQKLKLQFRIYPQAGETRRVLMDSLTQHVGGFVGQADLSPNSIRFSIDGLGARFEGQLTDAGRLTGIWKQGSAELDLILEKVERPELDRVVPAARPQTPKPPFPYLIQDVKFRNHAAGIELAGTLTLPNGAGPFPAAVLVSGSGPQDRNETLFEHKPFWVLADHLTRQGVAVLRYDERGVGESSGEFGSATTEDFTQDALSAVQFLKSQGAIDSLQIGVIGHSEGGLVAPWVATQDPSLAWIVCLAAPGVNGTKILLSQGRLIVAAAGGGEAEMNLQTEIQEVLLDLLNRGVIQRDLDAAVNEGTEQVLVRLKKTQTAGSALNQSLDSEEFQTQIRAAMRANLIAANTPWFRYFARHEPGPILKQVRCPVLALNGEKDVQVDPQLNLPEIEAALRSGGNSAVTVRTLPGLNHLFQKSATGSVTEYETNEQTLDPSMLEAVTEWILEQARRAKSGGNENR